MANIRDKEWLKIGADGLTFGERLGDLINAAGISQAQLEKETGIKQSSISEYINGRKGGIKDRAPDCATIIALAKYFSVSTDYLLGQTKITTQNADIKSICTYTGLSEIALTSILRETQREDTRTVLNVILGFDPSSFHRFIKNAAKGIEIQRKYMNKPFNWDLVPKEIRTELFDYFDIDPDGIENVAERTRARYFKKATNYLKMVLLEYLISPTGKPLVEYDDEENLDGVN